MDSSEPTLIRAIEERGRPLDDLGPLLARIGDARLVLLGEASHGTHEFYTHRAEITKRLIEEKGFRVIAVEGDWPDAYALNRYIAGKGDDGSAREVLGAFRRWPTWMWANHEIAVLGEWLARHNSYLPPQGRVGFYGFDVYSLWESLEAVRDHVARAHPDLLAEAEEALGCFAPYERDAQSYGWSTRFAPRACEDEVVALLQTLHEDWGEPANDDPEEHFSAEMNARAARDAERYYRIMMRNDTESWNVRDTHMVDTLDALMERYGPTARAVVWAHNTHIGDARYTDMAREGMVNVGSLARSRYGEADVVAVGFSSYEGSVIAGRHWGGAVERLELPPAKPGSWEDLLHRAGGRDRLLLMNELRDVPGFGDWRGHRAVGVVYHPERERLGNYVPTQLDRRYDALIHLDRSQALHPLRVSADVNGEPAETYPFGV